MQRREADFSFESAKEFDKFIKKECSKSREFDQAVQPVIADIERAKEAALSGLVKEQACSSKEIVNLLNISFEDKNVTCDLYKLIMTKFYAVMRNKMYHLIKTFWKENKHVLEPAFEERKKSKEAQKEHPEDSDDSIEANDNPIPDDDILELASSISVPELQKQVLQLYQVYYAFNDASLFFKKCEFIYQNEISESSDE